MEIEIVARRLAELGNPTRIDRREGCVFGLWVEDDLNGSLAVLDRCLAVSAVFDLYGGYLLFRLSGGNVITFSALIVQREFTPASSGRVIGLSTAIGQFAFARRYPGCWESYGTAQAGMARFSVFA